MKLQRRLLGLADMFGLGYSKASVDALKVIDAEEQLDLSYPGETSNY